MTIRHDLLLLALLSTGCSSANEHRVVTPLDVDFDTAIEVIATSKDWHQANAAQARLAYGGLPAIDVLRKHLEDDRVIPTGYTTRSINSGNITVGEQALWTIQDMIETGLPKMYDNSYYVLRDGKAEQWLDQRRGNTLVELQIDATSTSLKHARQTGAHDAIEILERRLTELRSTR